MDKWGRIDALVNNAGIVRDKTFGKMDLADFRLLMDIHLMGAVYCTRAAWPLMQAQKYGRVVMTTSGTALWGNFGQSNYGAAKAAVIGLMNTLKLEGARDDLRVNTVSPIAATRMTAKMMPPDAVPFLKSEYISAAVAYLCSESCVLNGAIMSTGAGYYALARMEEAAGVFLNPDQAPSPELVAANLEQIGDFRTASPMFSSIEYVDKALARFSTPTK
jgi:NAD(P)-dependent dehydrogenase (short-subunit alcohol dehydrogenase family)